MDIADLDTLPAGLALETDVCIVGSGPAGLTIASELAGSGARVLILESGGLQEDAAADALNEFESVGQPRVATGWKTRNRIFGGTSHTWSGRCAEFDDIDYAARDWVPHSGWDITRAELAPFIRRAARHLGLQSGGLDSGASGPPPPPRKALAFDPKLIARTTWEFSREANRPRDFIRFGPRFLSQPSGAETRIMLNATVTQIVPNAAGTEVEAVEVSGPSGRSLSVRTRLLVLCAGGIENARMLLLSDRVAPGGLGNGRGQVGRFLMDHPRCPIGEFDPRDAHRVREYFGGYSRIVDGRRHDFIDGLSLSPGTQEAKRLLNCAAWVDEQRAPDNPFDAARRLARRGSQQVRRDWWAVASQPGLLGRAVRDRLVRGRSVTHKYSRLSLMCLVEQRPDPDSRVTLGSRLDRHGLRLPRIDWRISTGERESLAALGLALRAEFDRLGFPPLRLQDWIQKGRHDGAWFEDVAHATGTTRMARDPRRGVVDVNCGVHGIDGLYVAGSSVFPTAGHANPTQMIIALSVRLADHLKAQLAARRVPVRGPAMAEAAARR